MNSALKMCKGDFILLVQDDMFLERELDASPIADFLDQRPKYALVRFDSTYTEFHGTIEHLPDATRMLDVNMQGRYPYQDEPHLRRGNFARSFGFYKEGGAHGSASSSINDYFGRTLGDWNIARTEPRYFTHGGVESSMPERWAKDSKLRAQSPR